MKIAGWMVLRIGLLAGLFSTAALADDVPVLVRLTAQAQQDTTGCNFVKELATLAYEEVLAGRTVLWDSPSKELQIAPASLQAICTASGIKMGSDSSQLIYIYEYWEEEKESIKSRTQGFLFSARDRGGKEISFGYIEYKDIESACLLYKINTNVNGDYGATAASYISSKNYNFSLMQFAGQVVSGVEESNALMSAYRRGRAFNIQRGNVIPVQLKLIHLELITDPEDRSSEAVLSRRFIAMLDSFLRANEEYLYNNTADSLHELFIDKKWKVTRVQLTEIRRKDQSGINTSLVGITIFINGKELPEIPYRNLSQLELKLYNQSFIPWLTTHSYAHRLLSINNQSLGRAESILFNKALVNAEWNRLSDYVKYY